MNIIDLLLLLFVVAVAVFSAKKGFLLSLFNIIAYIISGIAAKVLSLPVTEYIYNDFIKERIISELYEIMPSGSVETELYAVVENAMASLPDFFTATAKQFGLYPDLSSVVTDSNLTAEMIESTYISSILCNVISVVVLVIMFVLFSFILKIILSLVNHSLTKEKHKVIRGANMFFGAAFGVIKGIIPAGAVCALLNILSPLINNANFSELVIGSYFCNLLADILK
ncbi:MAG: hypothetical protein E7573_05830 [Ruminococcaceae bacterium]|nr:hypothetical protein [Oscillospiraceae bacterium]MBR3595970.1 CvpA family protein [Clostridia bacterium]